jgi:hypothetical protein
MKGEKWCECAPHSCDEESGPQTFAVVIEELRECLESRREGRECEAYKIQSDRENEGGKS